MESRLAQFAALNQKDKATAYQSLLAEVLAQEDQSNLHAEIHTLVDNAVNQESVGLVISRGILSELVKALSEGKVRNTEQRKRIVEDTLSIVQPRIVSYEEQVNSLRFQLADILEEEEQWSDAARVLTGISLDSGQRSLPDAEKLRVYVRIVRLLLEDEDSVEAERYYNRAALLAHSTTERETLLQFKLCQARISDYSRKFLEAASRYHELSWVAEIDEEERKHMLSAAMTCAILAPAGPNRSRVLAALCRDERTAELPSFNILLKMFHDRILRPNEIKEFEGTLKPHQLAKISISSNDRLASAVADDDQANDATISTRKGPATVLDRAVMEHNLLASSKIYNNITFRGLGALLDLTPGAAETMARRMIEQRRLKGSIDQVEKLISFDVLGEEDDAQGKAGGLGDVEQVEEDTGAPFTKRWDMQIRLTAANVSRFATRPYTSIPNCEFQVETIVQHLTEKGLVSFGAVQA
ncbi:COP9 signalosome complex subunit 4 [Trametes pubescens]|uniref:COP9 signalosome complex subunit 4 n=1 Tax=Trametes pubescens TaxID=154538 RepID=A0A1M2V805_TRAPU|nr:COP9 signalosome complex subunit 4 [Trametes pubescens]